MNKDHTRETIQKQQEMFSQIAPQYDLMNHLITAWQDDQWRRQVIELAQLPASGSLLDLGAGTGKLAAEAMRKYPQSKIVAADITLPMMLHGRQDLSFSRLSWIGAAAGNLPFTDNYFDAVVSGFLVRNLSDLITGLKEQYRVLKPEGRIVILDTTQTPKNMLTPLIRFYLHRVIPFLGRILANNRSAYTYLPESTESFLRAEELVAYLASVGFRKVLYRKYMFGMIAVHWGIK